MGGNVLPHARRLTPPPHPHRRGKALGRNESDATPRLKKKRIWDRFRSLVSCPDMSCSNFLWCDKFNCLLRFLYIYIYVVRRHALGLRSKRFAISSQIVRSGAKVRDGFKLWYDLNQEYMPSTRQRSLALAQALGSYPAFKDNVMDCRRKFRSQTSDNMDR